MLIMAIIQNIVTVQIPSSKHILQCDHGFASSCQIKKSEERVCWKKKAEVAAVDKNQLLCSRNQEILHRIQSF